ncbi:hypothetical protein [Streptomyces sp. NPDC088184]|uniref:hypothetical protein n=1 Tax=unclassified Streptomyces TaxID=2593676 RepID=UPI0034136C40
MTQSHKHSRRSTSRLKTLRFQNDFTECETGIVGARNSFRRDEIGAPNEGDDAGPSRGLIEAARIDRVRWYHMQAKNSFRDAQRYAPKSAGAAEEKVVQALDFAARAFWWAEDSPLEERQHKLMHKIGRWKRKNLSCRIPFSGNTYKQRCPVVIAHKKMGLSIGFTAIRFCSICRQDLSSDACFHFRDRSYWTPGGADSGGPCRVCGGDSCDHREDTLYRAVVVGVISEAANMVLHEVSIVRKPAQPEARFAEIPIGSDELAESLGPGFLAGVQVNCDKCLGGCWGFTELPAEVLSGEGEIPPSSQ